EKSIRMVAPEFGIELIDLPFTCCPEPNSVRSFSDPTWLAMGARNLALAEDAGLNIMAACAGCFESLSMAKHILETDASAKERVNEVLMSIGTEYKGEVKVRHIQQVLYEEIGFDAISKRVVNPIKMRVVTHPGCHTLRPEKVLQVDDAEHPKKLDELVDILGIDSLDYMDKVMCCGAGVRGTNRDVAFGILREKMDSMMMVEPDAAVVFCPTCFISFEAGQRVVNRMFNTKHNIPVFYYTELLAIAMGLDGVEQILDEHRVKSDLITLAKRLEEKEIENSTSSS
ncbi:MAG: CoB--CoM heterodisulfide reductase iron-sulfur subunit B family protein, partial [Candidatus Thorarchaeota archaeon]|nr:CoB--CoM heterodisulfide reductase iron-sulfur subunit B family protein [Candidatus Thorarchaeota archaeon]